MDIGALIIAIAFAGFMCAAHSLWHRWAVNRLAVRVQAEVLAKMTSDYVLDISEQGVTCTRPNGTTESVEWTDLQMVKILTTDEGPYVPAVF